MPKIKPCDQPVSPRLTANPLKLLFFTWLFPILRKGFRKDLKQEDVYRVLPEDETKKLADRMEAAWMDQVIKAAKKNEAFKKQSTEEGGQGDVPEYALYVTGGKYKPSLIKALLKVFGLPAMLLGICAFLAECVFKLAQPIFLSYLLDYFRRPNNYQPYEAYIFAAGVVIFTIIHSGVDHPFSCEVLHLGMKMRISLSSLIYRKSLRVSKYAMDQTSHGQIINYLSADMNRFDIFFMLVHYIWIAPIQLVIVILILYFHADMGYSSLVSLVLIAVFVPFQYCLSRKFGKLRVQTADKTDARLLALEEILAAMRIIKMYTWEKPYCDLVSESRKAEVERLKISTNYRAINEGFFSITSRVILLATLAVYMVCGNTLTATKVYLTLSLYHAVEVVMAVYFPLAMVNLAETLVSLARLRRFLLMEEKILPSAAIKNSLRDRVRRYDWTLVDFDDTSITSEYTYNTASFGTTTFSENGVWVREIFARWKPQDPTFAFRNVTFDVRGGEVLAIVGPTASGKSSILYSLLYELPLIAGSFRIAGKIAYASQEPWVFDGTVRDNILFGKPYSASWYDQVTEACALTSDFQLLAYGDLTSTGVKGSELSGGQKARVTLARTVYADADIYLLDDIFSAVDNQVGRHIMEKCILGLLKNKCRILVTHQMHYVKMVDKVLAMMNGYMVHIGDPKSLLTSGTPFAAMITPPRATPQRSRELNAAANSPLLKSAVSVAGTVGKVSVVETPPVIVGNTTLEDGPEEAEEAIKKGRLGWRTFYKYFHAGSSWFYLFLLLMSFVVSQGLITCSDLWLQYWIQIEEMAAKGKLVSSSSSIVSRIQESRHVRIAIYAGIMLLLVISYQLHVRLFFRRCLCSSVAIYDSLFYAVVRSPMSFFEQTSVGRILNRFAKDISIIDELLPNTIYDVSEVGMQTLGIICVLAINTHVLLAPAFVIIVVCYLLRRFYFRTALSIKRLEGAARSPIFNHFATTITGLATIRAFEVEEKMKRDFEEIHDVHNSCWYLFLCGTRWLGITVDWIVVFFIAGVELNFLLEKDEERYSVAGLSISSVMVLSGMLQWGMRQNAEMENYIIAYERVLEYCELPPEAALESIPSKKPPDNWPYDGSIKIQNLFLHYKLNEKAVLVLRNINCTIKGREKVGIVGRTGAGKSSLINVLFRIVEPTSGCIEIDGIVTTSIGLHDLRSQISIIPQEPVIFGGTVRHNLDPFGRITDELLWKALAEVHLVDTVNSMEGGLDAEVGEGGSCFSSGQRQLFCLARCILSQNKILVLDEATANLDPETDSLIQKTIRKNFSKCTVLTIAHRLQTVMDSDRILVLSAGQIMEFDEPQVLLSNRHGTLYNMVQAVGKTDAAYLAQIAKIAAMRRNQLLTSTSRDSANFTWSNQSFTEAP